MVHLLLLLLIHPQNEEVGVILTNVPSNIGQEHSRSKTTKEGRTSQETKAREGTDKLERIRKEAALATFPQAEQDIERSMEILPKAFGRGAWRNVVQRVNDEIASSFPVSAVHLSWSSNAVKEFCW
jgi:hypothetical protein